MYRNLLLSLFTLIISPHIVQLGSALEVFQQRVVVNASELCTLQITPDLFKWEKQAGYVNQIEYTARISNSPDLPGWLQYTYDGFSSVGYLFGVPPSHIISMNLDIIAWNKYEGYDVRKLILSLEIIRKNPKEYILEMKIDNLNVKDLCIARRMNQLSSVLSEQLSWTKNEGNRIVPVFMASAVVLGENRVPVRPNEAEGVVIHFASDSDFSPELKKLQVEVLPLWKLRPCPRDLKRTSMERYFRRYSLLVDWCSFRLTTRTIVSEDYGKGKEQNSGSGSGQNSPINEGNKFDEDGTRLRIPSEPEVFHFRSEIPERKYGMELLISTAIPCSIGGLVGFLLVVLLWTDRDEDAPVYKERNGSGNGNRNGNQYIYHQPPQQDAGVVVMTRDNGHSHPVDPTDEREFLGTPVPPQYGETHPNGTPALIYAV